MVIPYSMTILGIYFNIINDIFCNNITYIYLLLSTYLLYYNVLGTWYYELL